MNKPYFVLSISYPASERFRELDDKIIKLAKTFKGKETGSGMGFGLRDIQFEFKNLNCANLFYKKARENKLIHKKVSCTFYTWK